MASDQRVGTPWAVTATAPPGQVRPADLDAALAWCAERAAGRGWTAVVSAGDTTTQEWLRERGLDERAALPVLAMTAGASPLRSAGPAAPPAEVYLDPHPDRAAVVAGYGSWMEDEELAAALVRPADLSQPRRRFVVARAGGEVVGAALVWLPGTTVHLSGLGVVPGWRGRGVGRALVVAAARLGLEADPRAAAVWMHASDEGLPLYARLGFAHVDEHRRFGPSGG